MNHLTRNDFAAALRLLMRIETQADDVDGFARAAVVALNGYVASELTTLSVCDLRTGHRQAVGVPEVGLGADEVACVDRHVVEDPVVHFHGLEHAIAVPLYQDAHTLVSIVLNRSKLGFAERDRERLELLRPHLAFLYCHACRATAHAPHAMRAPPRAPSLPDPTPGELTVRERDVLQWLACGKTDADIAALLSISPRTVHKHLEHIYVKLGVETRTAAVMRVLRGRESHAVAAP